MSGQMQSELNDKEPRPKQTKPVSHLGTISPRWQIGVKQWKGLPQELAHLSADDQLFGLDVLFILTNLFSGFNWQLCWKFISMSVAMFTFDALNSIFCVCHKRNNWNQLQIGTLLIGEGVKTCFPMHPIAWVQLFTFWLLLLTTTHSPDMRQTTWIGFGKRSILIPLSTALLEYPYGFAS